MIGVRKGIRGNLVLAILVLASVSLQCRGAPTLTVLTSFAGTNGSAPEGSLIANAAGDLFGTTTAGGVSNACSGGCGTVFRLTPPAAGKTNWKETVLTSFTGANGYDPSGSLLSDRTGNLYGTTYWGGASQGGTVFELSPPTAGQAIWKETVLVAFTGNNDGGNPAGGLIADKAGNLYGTARSSSLVPGCGFGGCGNVFELIGPPAGQSSWTENVLFTFNYSDGDGPVGNLLIDKKGNLYGTTYLGGADEFGTVFKLLPPSAGENTWTEAVLASLDCANGCEPQASLIADKAGNLYGTASDCIFLFGCGSVFELSPPTAGQGTWTETVLTVFAGTNGSMPLGSLIADAKGNLYGTTSQGGDSTICSNGCGTVFKLSPPAAGQTKWTQTVLAKFRGSNGSGPGGSLIADKAGNLFGTTYAGGSHGYGTVFELSSTGFVAGRKTGGR